MKQFAEGKLDRPAFYSTACFDIYFRAIEDDTWEVCVRLGGMTKTVHVLITNDGEKTTMDQIFSIARKMYDKIYIEIERGQ